MSLDVPPSGCKGDTTAFDVPHFHASWDAGDTACGELVLRLRMRMRQLDSGQTLRLTARDPGASADIPAWCRVTGHLLLRTDPATQTYYIQRP